MLNNHYPDGMRHKDPEDFVRDPGFTPEPAEPPKSLHVHAMELCKAVLDEMGVKHTIIDYSDANKVDEYFSVTILGYEVYVRTSVEDVEVTNKSLRGTFTTTVQEDTAHFEVMVSSYSSEWGEDGDVHDMGSCPLSAAPGHILSLVADQVSSAL